MSGPKVVRIVTREEIEAICRREIASVEAAASELTRRARRCGMLDQSLERAVAGRLAGFDALFARAAWMEIQKAAPQAATFMRSEGDRIETAATAASAAARTRGRRAADAARSVATAIEAASGEVPAGLRAVAEGQAASPEEAERQVAAALALVPPIVPHDKTDAARTRLARDLGAVEGVRSVADLIAARAHEPTATERRLDRLLAELEVLTDDYREFASRADAIAREPDVSRRALLTDSLMFDAGIHVAMVRARGVMTQRLREAEASLTGLSSQNASALRARLSLAAASDHPESAGGLVGEAATLVEADSRAVASLARRRAVLSGLASLGYEVRETMVATWAREGRIVVRKPGTIDYGVELGAPADAARLQVRLVGADQPSLPRTPGRDADQEAIWCSEFDRLRGHLAARGGELIVERALAPGEQALRTVPMPHALTNDAATKRGAKTR